MVDTRLSVVKMQQSVDSPLTTSAVAIEKLHIYKKGMILGDGKWSVVSYKSLVGHPGAMKFL
jgi:hypothetical protein